MELRDLIVTPLLLIILGVGAIVVRPYFTDELTRRYFLPALWLKIIGALTLGFIYQFYYSGGDTFAYHTHGSRIIWESFIDFPPQGMKLFFANGQYEAGYWEYADKIWYWRDAKSFFVIRIAFLFDLITFSTYSATAVLFSIVSFIGGWMLFTTFYKMFPSMHRWIAGSCLFIPSILFWGSGILKDTIAVAFLCMLTSCFYSIFIQKRIFITNVFLLILSFYIVFSVKKYILLSFVVASLIWVFAFYFKQISNIALRILLIPITIILCILIGYLAVNRVAEDDPQYALDRIAETSKITAYDIRYGWGARSGQGSGYTLGELDGSILSMIKLAPNAIAVTLYRPYLWEVNNPLMLFAAIESLVALLITIYVVRKTKLKIFKYLKHPPVLFCAAFSFLFAFGVGVSTYNFGTLARYKIPLLPFYFLMLGMILFYSKSDEKADELASTEN